MVVFLIKINLLRKGNLLMKLKVTKKIGSGLLMTLLLIVISNVTVCEGATRITVDWETFTYTKIIAAVINVMVMLIVIFLLSQQKKSKSVREFMAAIGKQQMVTDRKAYYISVCNKINEK